MLKEKLIESKDTQIITTDTDARALLVQGQVVEVSYNMQAAVDSKHNLPIASHTINRNDRKALSHIALEAKANLGIETFTALVDKGYHNGGQLQTCKDQNITTICANPELVNSNGKDTTPEYMARQYCLHAVMDWFNFQFQKNLKKHFCHIVI